MHPNGLIAGIQMSRQSFLQAIGFSDYKAGSGEILISGAGGFSAILTIFLASNALFGSELALAIVPSMGASAVLLFAAPQAPFSQPWNVFAGHLLSALIGVACWRFIPDLPVAAAAAVGIAIGAMYFTRCLHPPGGATALAAVIGPVELHALGFGYALQPILFNVVVILVVAVLFNSLFNWRRYPVFWQGRMNVESGKASGYAPIEHGDFVYALSQIDTIVDVTEDDLLKIYQLATRRHQQQFTADS